MFEYWSEKYGDYLIPLILVLLVGGILAIRIFNLYWIPILGPLVVGPEGITRVLVVTNIDDHDSAASFAKEMESRVPGITTVIDDNVLQHIKAGYITSNNYDLVVLYGDKTALTYEARKELASYLGAGGNLLIVKGAGLKGLNSDGTYSPYIFSWGVDDLAGYMSFAPDCKDVSTCNSVEAITVTPAEVGEKLTFTPTDWEHPIIQRIGINAPLDIDVTPQFSGAVEVDDLANQRIAYLGWRDAENKPHTIPAIIAYGTGTSGGRIVYLAYNPLELNQEELFRNILLWVVGKI